MRANKARKHTLSEIKKSFVNMLVCSALILIFGIMTLFLGSRHSIDVFILGIVQIFGAIFLFIYGLIGLNNRKKRFYRYMQSYSFCVDSVTRTAVETFVHPMIVISEDGKIIWCNELFCDMIGRNPDSDEYIQDVFSDLAIGKYVESEILVVDEYEYGGRIYKINGHSVKSDSVEETMIGLYFVDVTDLNILSNEIVSKQCVECLIVIDNYDEVIKETPNSNHGALRGEIERCINSWVSRGNGVVRRYEREKFIVFFHHKDYVDVIENEKYKLLSEVRDINLENKIPVTLSVGTGQGGETLDDNNKMANLALEMALGRGGDQVVVKTPTSYKFYGAKTREVEKSTKVKARVMAHALREAIDQASSVVIMGHKNADMDCMGSAIGLYQAIEGRGANTYIVTNKNTSNAKILMNNFINDSKYMNNIVSGDKALTYMDKQSLVIVVDTHRRSMVEYEEILNATKTIVLIDHHRRSEDFIDNAVLTYHEPYASSTCEMVTEILQYIQDNPRIGKKEAEALYAGIFLDTKGFTFKTGVRTFEAAAYLRRIGVDPVDVRRLFKTDIEDCKRLSRIVSGAQIYRDNIAIVVCEETGKDLQVLVAKAADELLNIAGVEASFVIAKHGHKIIISGRSLETINVQVILERLGGGGHITIAGAQLSNYDMNEALVLLKRAIDDVLDDN